MIRLIVFILAISLLSTTSAFTQVKKSVAFEQLLNDLQLTFNEPTENSYKNKKLPKNEIFNCDFSIKAKRGDLEIRYAFKKLSNEDNEVTFPHIISMNTVNHIASNHEDSEIVVQNITEEDLNINFKADWAATFYFMPKSQFSGKRNCKMLALYKEGLGLVYVFFLFNKPSIELDNQFYSLNFES